MKKTIFLCAGFLCLALGAVGSVLPMLPATPFLLLASVCFAKGSSRFSTWFKHTQLYKKHLEGFEKNRTMPLKTKIAILLFATSMLLIAFFMMHNLWGRLAILFVIAGKYYYFCFRIKTQKPSQDIPAEAQPLAFLSTESQKKYNNS